MRQIIKTTPADASKISPIARAAKYAQDNNIDFDDAYKIIKTSEKKITLKKQPAARNLAPIEQVAMREIETRIRNLYPNISEEQMNFIKDDAIKLMNNPKYSNMYYLNFVDKVVGMYTNS